MEMLTEPVGVAEQVEASLVTVEVSVAAEALAVMVIVDRS